MRLFLEPIYGSYKGKNPQEQEETSILYRKVHHIWEWRKIFIMYNNVVYAERLSQEEIVERKEKLNISMAMMQRDYQCLNDSPSENRIFDQWYKAFFKTMDCQWKFVEGCWRTVSVDPNVPVVDQYVHLISGILQSRETEDGNIKLQEEISVEKLSEWAKTIQNN